MIRGATICLSLTLLFLGAPSYAQGQEQVNSDLLRACLSAAPSPSLDALCHDVVVGIELLQPEIGIVLAGGSPVLGTASPLGAKFRFIPRAQLGGRISFVVAELPDIINYPDEPGAPVGTVSFLLPAPQLDVDVGLFSGLNVTETLGGFLAVELLGSLTSVILPSGAGFVNDATGLGLGARLGLLRESFTAPGISVSATYKWIGRIQFGDVTRGDDGQFGLDMRVSSFRGGLSKSFSAIGLALTLGYDNYDSDVDFGVAGASGDLIPVVPEGDPLQFDSWRWSAFVDVTYIVLYFHFVAELGWGEAAALTVSSGDEITSGNLFGAIGIRITL